MGRGQEEEQANRVSPGGSDLSPSTGERLLTMSLSAQVPWTLSLWSSQAETLYLAGHVGLRGSASCLTSRWPLGHQLRSQKWFPGITGS